MATVGHFVILLIPNLNVTIRFLLSNVAKIGVKKEEEKNNCLIQMPNLILLSNFTYKSLII